MEVPRGTLSTETLLSIASDDNIRRYHEAAIDLYEAERAIDSVVPHDDLLNFEELFASRPSASSFVCDRAPDESDLSREFDLCIGSGSCSSSMGSAVALPLIPKISMLLFLMSSKSELLLLGRSILLWLRDL